MSKYRVHELGKELGISSKEIITQLQARGDDIKSHMSILTDEQVQTVKNRVKKPEPKGNQKEQTPHKKEPHKQENRAAKPPQKNHPVNHRNENQATHNNQGAQKNHSANPNRRHDHPQTQKSQGVQKNHVPNPHQKSDHTKGQGQQGMQRNNAFNPHQKSDHVQQKAQNQSQNQNHKPALRNLSQPAPKKSVKRPKIEKVVEEELDPNVIVINVPITVKGFAEQIDKSTTEVIMKLMGLGIMATINQNIDEDIVLVLADEFGLEISIGKVDDVVVELGIDVEEDKEEDLKSRSPIIAVMGHVDHGKTSLLDAIRNTNITASESGGITQHIGASEVYSSGNKIVCLDTPGHEAFTAMRARGAQVTDIAILVVAADDSVKPQTVEAISHAKAAGVPVIVAINKVDKPEANVDRVKQDLMQHGIVIEEFGGDVICVPVSAKTGMGIDNLLEMVLLQADVLELKANPDRLAKGTVIEARLDKAKGPVTTIIVQKGTLTVGTPIVAGTCSGRIRAMHNWRGEPIRKAGPSTAVEILGLQDVPEAGDEVDAVREEKQAKNIASNRQLKLREETLKTKSHVSLENLFSQIQKGNVKELNIIVKADVQGSVGAIIQSLEKLSNDEVAVHIVYSGVGTVTESDVMLASASNALIIGFNVRPPANIISMADREKVEVRTYRIIYEAISDIEAAMKGMLDPEYQEVILGRIEIRATFKVPGAGTIGGSYVLDGKVQRNAQIRLVRDGIVIHEGKISSLRRFKDDVKEVASGYECGVGIENYNDIKEGDIVEAFAMEEIKRK